MPEIGVGAASVGLDPGGNDQATHAVGNSRALLDEAEILFERERWARAAALAVLSVEESGKAHLCHVWAFHIQPPDYAAWAEFWDDFADHPGKIDRWLSRIDQIGACTDFGAWKHQATIAHLSKLWCLYVDFTLPDRKVSVSSLSGSSKTPAMRSSASYDPRLVTSEHPQTEVHQTKNLIRFLSLVVDEPVGCRVAEEQESTLEKGRWRRVNAPELVALVRAGARFVNGRLVERDDKEDAA